MNKKWLLTLRVMLAGLFFAGNTYAATIVNTTPIGTSGAPFSGDGISDHPTDADNTITNNANIYVTGYGIYNYSGIVTNNAIVFSSGWDAIKFGTYGSSGGGTDSTFINTGTVTSEFYTAVLMGDGNDTLTNSGTINAEDADCHGIDLGSGNDTFTNSGTINIDYADCHGITLQRGNDTFTNTSTGVINIDNVGQNGIVMGEGTDTLTNAGTINIIHADSNGIDLGSHADTFTNSGTITIGRAECFGIFGGYDSETDTFTNSGTINITSANCHAITLAGGNDVFSNSGTITIGVAENNGIVMGNGVDSFTNSGTINVTYTNWDAIDLGSAADTFNNSGTINIGRAECFGIMGGYDSETDTFTNSGTINITSANCHAITLAGGDDVFNNSGTINIGVAENNAIVMGNGTDSFTNSGTITVTSAQCNAIDLGSGDDTFTNSKTINVSNADCFGIFGGWDAGADDLTNSGTINIQHTACHAIALSSGDDTFTNTSSGTVNIVLAEGNGFAMGIGNDELTNAGTMTINTTSTGIDMGSDNDTLENSGTLNITTDGSDAINLNGGDDTLILSGAVNVNDDIDGGDDYDEIYLEGTGDFTIDEDVVNFEYLAKSGTGSWTFDADLEIDGTVDVDEGTLIINGSLYPDLNPLEVYVDAGAALGGNGTITGDVFNSGSLTPGASVGTLTISGDYTQEIGSTLDIEVDGSSADLLSVSGTATINGGDVVVTPSGLIADGATHTILTAGTYAGAFDGISTNSVVLDFTLDDTSIPNTVQIIADRTDYADLLSGSAGSALDELLAGSPSGIFADLLLALDQAASAEELQELVDSMDPDIYGSSFGIMLNGITAYRGVALDRLSALRSIHGSESSVAGALTKSGPVLANVPVDGDRSSGNWSAWGKVFGNHSEQDNHGAASGYEFDYYGPSLGIDTMIGDNSIFGISWAYVETDVDFNANTAETDIDAHHVSVYGSTFNDEYYVDYSLGYASGDYDSRRDVLGSLALGSRDGDTISAYVGGGLYMGPDSEGWDIIPTLSLAYAHHEEDSFTETIGGVPFLTIGDSESDSLVSRLGVRLTHDLGEYSVGELRAQWAHEFLDDDQTVNATFAGTTTSFATSGIEYERDSAILGAGLKTTSYWDIDVFLDYDYEVKQDFDAHNFSLGIRKVF